MCKKKWAGVVLRTDFMNGNLRIMSSSELEECVNERQLRRYCTLESGTRGLTWSVWSGSYCRVCSQHLDQVNGAASLTDPISPIPPDSGPSLEWQSLITEGSHHFAETKVHSIGFLFLLTIYMLSTLSNVQ
uniref:Uncharacterized protein n=1 Tax=Molossus molossus TaxID=27622 RepID=A0A7J8J0D8_MOLMO|nr:hypothetical protein HJG59_010332 [Molossus molossus]